MIKNLKTNTELWIQSFKYKQMQKQKPQEIEIRTKRIGKHRLNKIITITFEKCDNKCDYGWEVSSCFDNNICVSSWGETKKQAMDDFIIEFEKNLFFIKEGDEDLLQ